MRAWDPIVDGAGRAAGVEPVDDGRRGARRGGRGGARDRVAGAQRTRLGRGRRAHAQRRCSSTAATCSSPRSCERRASVRQAPAAGPSTTVSLPAVILVGGLGTRLRPLTDRTRKDMLPLVDRPQLAYTFEHLRRSGVSGRSSRCGYLPTQIEEHFGDRYGDLRLEYRAEEEPLGTGGRDPLRGRGDRRALLRPERRLAARDRPRRAPRLPPRARPTRDDPADAGRGPEPLRPRPRRRRRPRAQLPREAATRGDRHEPDQRGPLRARARRARADSARAVPCRSSARSSRSSSRSEAVYGVALPGYWLDIGTPEAYLQAHRDVLERNFVTELGDRARVGLRARRATERRGQPGRAARTARASSATERGSARAPASAASR